jgi:hypothetical protein
MLTCLALPAACGFDEGPSLDVAVQNPTLQPTAGSPTVCCCRVTGSLANRSTVPVHVDVAFNSYVAGDPKPNGRALDFVENMQPGETRNFTAVGFVQSCSSISKWEQVQPLNVRAVWLPK